MAEFQFFPTDVAEKAFAEGNGRKVSGKDNGARQEGASGILGISFGIQTFDIDLTSVCPVSGASVDMWDLFIQGAVINVGFFHNGKFYVGPYRIMSADIDEKSKDGTSTGSWKLENAGPLTKVA